MAPLLHFSGIDEKLFLPVPSLESMCITKLAIALWNLPQIRLLLDNLRSVIPYQMYTFRYSRAKSTQNVNWKLIETKVTDCAKELRLPKVTKNKVVQTIKHVGREIFKWKKYHEFRFEVSQDYDVLLPAQLFWTAFGTIDRKKTAQGLVKDSNVCVDLRYKFACCYCLEKDVAELWKELPDDYKINFRNNHNAWENLWLEVMNYRAHDELYFHNTPKSKNLERFWSYVMIGGGNSEGALASEHYPIISEFLMQLISGENNVAALQYFFMKFTQELRNQFLERIVEQPHDIFGCPSFVEVFFFLLSLLDEFQQKRLIATSWCVNQILLCFFIWPWNTFFMPVARCLYPFLDSSHFLYLLCHGVYMSGNQELFAEFFKCSPEHFKQYTVDKCYKGLLFLLMKRGNKRLIQMIWKQATVEKRVDIINAYEKDAYIGHYNEWDRDMRMKRNERWENLFLMLLKLSREDRKRNYLMKKRKREDIEEERNAKKFRTI